MEFKDLAQVNANLKTTPIKGKDYVEVNERIKAFRQLFPNGTITTEIVSITTDEKGKGVCVFKATALNEQGFVLGTGHAYEKEGSSFINSTSYIENAETSAVGRALGMIGIGIDASIASFDEVANAVEQQKTTKAPTQAQPKATAKATPKKAAPVTPAAAEPTPEPETETELPFEITTETYRDKFRAYKNANGITDKQVAKVIKECGLTPNSPDAEWEKGLMYMVAMNGGVVQ